MKTFLIDAVGCLFSESWVLNNELYEVLEKFSNRKIIVTGANKEQMIQFGLTSSPYEVFSLAHDPEKSDPKYFSLLLKYHNLVASEVLYIEHALKATQSAESLGITSHLYNWDAESVAHFLQTHLSK